MENKEEVKVPVVNKISRNDFRHMVSKERMLNGKAFEDCSRMELFEMIMSLAKTVGTLTRQQKEQENKKLKNRIRQFWLKITGKSNTEASTQQKTQ